MEDLITIEKILELGFVEQEKEFSCGHTWYKKDMLGVSKLDENIYGYCFLISFTFEFGENRVTGENEEITHLHKKRIKYMYELNNLCVALINN